MSVDKKNRVEKMINWTMFLSIILIAGLGAMIGLRLMVYFGFSPLTSIIGVMFALIFARLPFRNFKQFNSIHLQNLMQTAIYCGTFGAANALFIPIGVPFLLGRNDLIIPMFIGAILAMVLDALLIYRLFDTKLFPAQNHWPQGMAIAETILTGDKGGKRVKMLGVGMIAGLIGAFFHLPFSALGIAFLTQTLPITALALGTLTSVYLNDLFQINLSALYFSHGVMIGAGMVILFQTALIFLPRRDVGKKESRKSDKKEMIPLQTTVIYSCFAFALVSIVLAIISGLVTSMSFQQLIIFIFYAVLIQLVQRLIVGKSAMITGFIPAFSLAFVYLVVGILIGFPQDALGILVGLSAATGPIFASMGYTLKTGYVLRGMDRDPVVEKKGRQQQLYVVLLTSMVAIFVVLLSYPDYFAQKQLPPINHAFMATIKASVSTEIIPFLLIGAMVGVGLQCIKGTGVLFATGLLIQNPLLGWMIVIGVIMKVLIKRKANDSTVTVFASGLIAGDVIGSIVSAFFRK